MSSNTRVLLFVSLACLLATAAARPAAGAEPVKVAHATGATDVARLNDGAHFYTDLQMTFRTLPAGVRGLAFTRRAVTERCCDVTVDVPAGVPCYLITGSSTPTAEAAARAAGWRWVARAELVGDGNDWEFEFYFRPAGGATRATIPTERQNQVRVAAADLTLAPADGDRQGTADRGTAHLRADSPGDAGPVAGAATADVRLAQTSINALEVLEPGAGMIALGQTSELILTVTRSDAPHRLDVTFVTPVGPEMRLARDEAERFVGVRYPNWRAGRAELSFEDKYNDHDGGSIGAAVATLIESAVDGVRIDPAVAMTGDVSANGKVRAIGEVAAKLRGAAAGHCTVAVVPADNYDQLTDAVIYAGPTIATDVQVLGVSTVADAVAAARADRDPKLVAAVQQFGDVAAAVRKSPAGWGRPEVVRALGDVLVLAPNHLSAKCLLAVANGTAPRTLSVGASRYYAFTAGESMLTAVVERAKLAGGPKGPSSVVRLGLASLRKLRPLADASTRPLIDDWASYIGAADAYVNDVGSRSAMERRRQALLDEMSKLQADPEMMQKVMRQGM